MSHLSSPEVCSLRYNWIVFQAFPVLSLHGSKFLSSSCIWKNSFLQLLAAFPTFHHSNSFGISVPPEQHADINTSPFPRYSDHDRRRERLSHVLRVLGKDKRPLTMKDYHVEARGPRIKNNQEPQRAIFNDFHNFINFVHGCRVKL